MLVCPSCGTQNALGRVFCSQCGGKLDLTAMTSEAVAESVRPGFFAAHWKKMVVVVVIIVLALAGLALWPKMKPIGTEGKPVPGRRVQSDIAMLARAPKGQSVKRSFTESGVNGYFAFVANKTLKKTAISVDVQEGWCAVRMVRNLGKLDLKFYEVPLRLSFDIKCSPVGGRLHAKGATMGHMPMFPPFKNMVVKEFYKRVSGLKEWEPLTSLSEITMADDKVVVVYKK